MPEQIPFGVATSIINTIASSAFREIGRIYGVMMDDLEKLKDTLESIKVVLSDAELKQGQDATVAHWVKRFKQVLYDVDDLLDDVFIKDLRRKASVGTGKTRKARDFLSISDNSIVFHAKLARKIENIRKNFNEIAEDMSKLNLSRSVVILKQDECGWRETSSSILQSEIIGREENKSEIVNLLKKTHPNQNVSLIVVVGIGGLGKTALAQLVYNAAQDQNLFHKYMWVCVSEDFEVKTILKKMLQSLKKDADGDSLEALQQKLREELNGQKYMLVLDDVWNEEHLKWNDLRSHLMCGGQGSKLLVTTRSKLVSQAMGVDAPYVLKGLTDKQSWTLLKHLIFGDDSSKMNSKFQTIGDKIANKCEGVPLAIRTIVGLLRTRVEDADEWSSLLNGDIWRLCKEEQSIMPVLNLSYRNLPLELRQCFAYCCLYPKDSMIQKDECIQLWMAQVYLASSTEMQSMEDVGNQYVNILLMRSFFQDASMDENGYIRYFKMHDLMHDLAMQVAGNDCYLDTEGKKMVGKPIHVAFETRTCSSLDAFEACKLRTIIRGELTTNLMVTLFFKEKLKYLRALCLSVTITQLPKSIDKAKHLRYLPLSYTKGPESLPESIGNLFCLQTLYLIKCSNLVSLPEPLGNLVCLQTLHLTGCSSLVSLPDSIDNLVCLQTLHLEGCSSLVRLPKSIGNLVCLQTLHLEGCCCLVSLPKSIGNLVCLQTLHLKGFVSLVSTPESIGNLVCLQRLILNDCWSLVFPAQIIVKLIHLKKLDIEDCKAFNDGMPVGFGRLVSLQALPNFVVGNSERNASAKLNELKELDDLRGKLIVSNLGLVKDPESEWHETNLRSKKHIQELSLLWGPDSNEMKNSDSLVLLDNLCPHQNLRSLNVDGFPGVRFSDWIISLTNIVDINLFNLPNCKYLPPLERLPCLRKLKILYMGSLEWIHYYENIGDVFFPSLEQLYFCNCENFRGWERLLGDDKNANETENHLSLPPFPPVSCLSKFMLVQT